MSPDDFRRLVAAGLNTEQVAVVMEMMDRDARAHADAEEARKAKGRDRVAKWRLEHGRNVTVMQPKVTVPLTGGDARVEDKLLTTEIPKEGKNTHSADADAFKAEFADLDPERLVALVEHRRRKRAAMTGRSARMFRADAEKCGLSIAEAVDTCIRRNWIALEPEWLPGARAGPKPNPTLQAVDSLLEQMNAVPTSPPHSDQTYPRLVAPAGRG